MSNLENETSADQNSNAIAEIKRVIRGPIIIVDDAFRDGAVRRIDDKIVQIKDELEREGFMVVAYPELPSASLDLSTASFVILDWNMSSVLSSESTDIDSFSVALGSELLKDTHDDVLHFIGSLLEKHPVPVFIFTNEPEIKVRESIDDYFDKSDKNSNELKLIDIKSKSDMSASPDALFQFFNTWFNDNPAAYVMATWRNSIVSCANDLFRRLYDASPNWPIVIWSSLLEDISDEGNRSSHDKQVAANELGAFLTRVLNNTLSDYCISHTRLCGETESHESTEVVRNVIQQERFVEMNTEERPDSARCGDLYYFFQDGITSNSAKRKALRDFEEEHGFRHGDLREYLLVISADCDLSREHDPLVAVVAGEAIKVPQDNIVKVSFDNQGVAEIYVYGETRRIISGECEEINGWIRKRMRDNPRVGLGGDLLRRHDETIIPCIAGEKAIAFKHKILMCKLSDIKGPFIGRLLPPYVTKVQQGASSHLVRAGLEPVPAKVFE